MTTVSRSGLTMVTNAAPSSPTAGGQRRQIAEDVRVDPCCDFRLLRRHERSPGGFVGRSP